MTSRQLLIPVLAGVLALPVALRADDERLKTAETVLREMAGASDKGVAEGLIQKSKCIVIIPGVKKGAIGVGGQYGRGYISCRKDSGSGWSAPGGVRIEGGSFGLQIGGTDSDVLMLVMNDRGVDRMLASKFTVGADAAVAAGPVGRQANAQTDATMMAEILAWSRARGVFAGLSLEGSTLREDNSENKALYGKELANKEIVKGNTPVPKSAESLIAFLSKY